jgi:hypothetical protein
MYGDGGEGYPWGKDPWPGTRNIKDDLKNHPEAKDGFWFHEGEFEAQMARIKSFRRDFDTRKVNGRTARENLVYAGNPHDQSKDFGAKDFGQWGAALGLYTSASGAQSLMLQAYDYFIKALDAVIERLENTKKTNTGVEVDNVDTVTYRNIVTIDLGANPRPDPPADPGQS